VTDAVTPTRTMSDASQDDDDDDDVGDDGSLADKSASSFSSASFKVNRPLSDALHRRQQVGEKTLTAEGGVRGGGANAALPSPRRTAYSAVSNAVRLYSTSRILEFCLNFFRILQ